MERALSWTRLSCTSLDLDFGPAHIDAVAADVLKGSADDATPNEIAVKGIRRRVDEADIDEFELGVDEIEGIFAVVRIEEAVFDAHAGRRAGSRHRSGSNRPGRCRWCLRTMTFFPPVGLVGAKSRDAAPERIRIGALQDYG